MSDRLISLTKLELTAFLAVLALAALLYRPGLEGPLLLDDYPQLGNYFSGTQLSNDKLFEQLADKVIELKRPVSRISFAGNYVLNEDNLFAWKLTNLLIHLFCGIVWFCFLLVIQRILKLRWGLDCRYMALIATTFWLLHPLQVSTTLYLVQRMAQLATLFMALGLLTYAIGRLREIKGQSGRNYLWCSVLLFLPLAILSKQNGVLLLILILVTELFICRFACSPVRKREFNFFLLAGVAAPVVIGLVILAVFFDPLVLEGYEGRPFGPGERLLTEFRVIGMYLAQFVWPSPASMYFFYENFTVSQTFFNPISTLVSLLVVLSLVVSAWLLRFRMPLYSFGIFFYFVSISVESSILPLELAFEHRNYIGLLGLSLASYSIVVNIFSKNILRYLSYIFVVSVLAVTTASRAETWSSKTNLYNYYYSLNPDSHRITAMLAEELTKQERYDQALRLLAGVNANGSELQSLYVRCGRGDDLDSLDYSRLSKNIRSPLDNYAVTGLIELSNMGLNGKCNINIDGFEYLLSEMSNRVYRDANDKHKINLYWAHYLWQQGRHDDAFKLLESLATAASKNPVPLYLAAEWALDIGKKSLARNYFDKAEEISKTKFKDYSVYRDSIMKRMKFAN